MTLQQKRKRSLGGKEAKAKPRLLHLQGPQLGPVSLPIGWRAQIVNDGNLPSREEHVFAKEVGGGSQEVPRFFY